MRKGCGCKSVNHFQSLSIVDVRSHRLSCLELERGEIDGVILGRLAAGSISGKATARGKERRRDRYSYTFSGQKVCTRVFRYVHAIGKERLENLQKHYQTKGNEPRVHGNKGRRPCHSLMYEQVEHVVRFLERHSESHGLPQPAAPCGRADTPPTYLPTSHNKKAVFVRYKEACSSAGKGAVGLTSFKDIWHRCMPHLKAMMHRIDCCPQCEKFRIQITNALPRMRSSQLT